MNQDWFTIGDEVLTIDGQAGEIKDVREGDMQNYYLVNGDWYEDYKLRKVEDK